NELLSGLTLTLADVVENRVRIMFESRCVFFTKLARFFDDRVFPHRSGLRKLLRSADYRRLIPVVAAYRVDLGPHRGVRNVSTVPRQKIIHSIYGGNRNMIRINLGLLRDRRFRN